MHNYIYYSIMQLRNRKIHSYSKHQLKILHLNKKYFDYNEKSSENSNDYSYIDPQLAGCNDIYDSDTSINLQIFLKNIFLFIMLFSMYAVVLVGSLQVTNNNTTYGSNTTKSELAHINIDYNKNNIEGLKIVSMVFSTNNIKMKLQISKNLKYFYKSLIKLDDYNHDVSRIYPKWVSFLLNNTNSSMLKLDDYVWYKNGTITNSYSLLKYSLYNPHNYVSININRNESINNKNYYPYLIVV